jgi:multiple sugar transport system ATP-binding protein
MSAVTQSEVSARISLEGVTKKFGEAEAIKNISLTLHEGEFVALLGASGCGKSTTLRLLAGLETATSGRVMLNGRDVTKEGPAARNIALMFQSYALYPHLTVAQNISMPLRLGRMSALQRLPAAGLLSNSVRGMQDAIATRVLEVATTLRLEKLLQRKPSQLSGGQQQRVALARALVRDPSAFLLDEPLSNLDTQLRGDTRDELRALHRRTQYPFLLVTHDQSDALSMADRIAVMIDGQIAQLGTPKNIFETPATIAVATFIGNHRMNMVPPGEAELLHAAGGQCHVGVRPEDVRISPEGKLEAVVESIAFHGEETIIRMKTQNNTTLRTMLRGTQSLPSQGQTVGLAVEQSAMHFFDHQGLRQKVPQ